MLEEEFLPKEGDLRVWWIPQVPMKAFHVSVKNVRDAKIVMKVLEDYDIFQYRNHVKPDYCNAGGLNVFEDGEWIEWYDDKGNCIDDLELIEMDAMLQENSINKH